MILFIDDRMCKKILWIVYAPGIAKGYIEFSARTRTRAEQQFTFNPNFFACIFIANNCCSIYTQRTNFRGETITYSCSSKTLVRPTCPLRDQLYICIYIILSTQYSAAVSQTHRPRNTKLGGVKINKRRCSIYIYIYKSCRVLCMYS